MIYTLPECHQILKRLGEKIKKAAGLTKIQA
jgi:hypothetical protein